MEMIGHIIKQMDFSAATFGPGSRQQGVSDHILKEVVEIAEGNNDPMEWVDVWLLSMDGAWRCLRDQYVEITDFELATMIVELRDQIKLAVVAEATSAGDLLLDRIRTEAQYVGTIKENKITVWLRINIMASVGLNLALRAENPSLSVKSAGLLGFTMIQQKQEKNERRSWPDWRTAEAGKAIQHVKGIED